MMRERNGCLLLRLGKAQMCRWSALILELRRQQWQGLAGTASQRLNAELMHALAAAVALMPPDQSMQHWTASSTFHWCTRQPSPLAAQGPGPEAEVGRYGWDSPVGRPPQQALWWVKPVNALLEALCALDAGAWSWICLAGVPKRPWHYQGQLHRHLSSLCVSRFCAHRLLERQSLHCVCSLHFGLRGDRT